MIFQHTIDAVLNGTKTQTRRVAKGKVNKCKYKVGKTYSVQPGRGKKGVARIRIVGMHNERLHEITPEDVLAEGIDQHAAQFAIANTASSLRPAARAMLIIKFQQLWDSIQPPGRRWEDNPLVWVIEFELVREGALMGGSG